MKSLALRVIQNKPTVGQISADICRQYKSKGNSMIQGRRNWLGFRVVVDVISCHCPSMVYPLHGFVWEACVYTLK